MNNQQQSVGETQNSQNKKPFYKRWWFITIAAIIVLSAIFGSSEDKKKEEAKNTSPATEVKQDAISEVKTESTESQPVQEATTKKIPYEIADEWNIPNGGKGERIVISADYLNEADMTSLGETLKEDVKSERNAIIMVHTDKKSAQIQKDSSLKMTEEQLNYVGKHYVGQYTKNTNSNINEFSIYLNGADDVSSYKTIKL